MLKQLLQALGIVPTPAPRVAHHAPHVARHNHTPRITQTSVVPHKPANQRMGTDLIAVIGFNDKAFPISLPAEPWGDKLTARVATLPSRMGGSGTNIASALRLALEMTRKCPKGTRRRIFLLSDGEHNTATHDTEPAAQAIADARINLNVLAFGEAANSTLLRTLAAKTHNGKFIPVASLHEMAAALKQGSGTAHTKRQHRQEVAIICVDLSPSMGTRDMGRHTRIEAVRDAIQSLLTYKANVWS